jgi:hypothetical protein
MEGGMEGRMDRMDGRKEGKSKDQYSDQYSVTSTVRSVRWYSEISEKGGAYNNTKGVQQATFKVEEEVDCPL